MNSKEIMTIRRPPHQLISVTMMLTSKSEREGGVVSAIPLTGKSVTVMQIGLVESFFTSLYLMCVWGEGGTII